jgi:hypothetical protein
LHLLFQGHIFDPRLQYQEAIADDEEGAYEEEYTDQPQEEYQEEYTADYAEEEQ